MTTTDTQPRYYRFSTWESVRARHESVSIDKLFDKLLKTFGSERLLQLTSGAVWKDEELQALSMFLVHRLYGPFVINGHRPDRSWVQKQAKMIVPQIQENAQILTAPAPTHEKSTVEPVIEKPLPTVVPPSSTWGKPRRGRRAKAGA